MKETFKYSFYISMTRSLVVENTRFAFYLSKLETSESLATFLRLSWNSKYVETVVLKFSQK